MSYATDLLDQAEHLAHLESGKPKQASLRRAVSTAYYALFHALVQDAALEIRGSLSYALEQQLRRVCDHGDMKRVCREFASANASISLAHLLLRPIQPEIVRVAQAFVELQDARHKADYDFGWAPKRRDARAWIRVARSALQDWERIKNSDDLKEDRRTFLIALIVPRIVSRRSA